MVDFFHFESLNRERGCLHAVTKRSSLYPFGLSMALHTGEARESIVANRKEIEKLFAKEQISCFVLADQTHSDHIHVVKEVQTKGWESLESAVADCDALVTDLTGVVLGVLTADCVPVLLYDPVQKAVAAIHAGWKGTRSRIVQKTVQRMVQEFGTKPKDIIAGIAPSIGVCCYEVGEDVASHFFELPEAVIPKGNGKYMLDLPLANRLQLIEAGIHASHIEMSHICTSCSVDDFFSYRKEQGCSGRFMSLIGMRNSLSIR